LEAMLRLNDYRLDAMDDEIEEVALRIAGSEGDYSYEEFVEGVRSKILFRVDY
jgi:prophage maintenance system killer protein